MSTRKSNHCLNAASGTSILASRSAAVFAVVLFVLATSGGPLASGLAAQEPTLEEESEMVEEMAADIETADLAKKSQNPVGDLISLPFQNNTIFGFGPGDDVKNVLNIQPVYPIHLSQKWNLINRVILPVIYQPELIPGQGSNFGLGDTSYTGLSAFLLPIFGPLTPTPI